MAEFKFSKIDRSAWIFNPSFDLFLFSSIWWVPFCLISFSLLTTTSLSALGGIFPSGLGIFVLSFHLFLRLPHFLATLHVTYLRPENHSHYKKHWFKYYLVPILILLIYTLFADFNPSSYFGYFLVGISLLWGSQHGAFQNYGILRVYQHRHQHRHQHHGRLLVSNGKLEKLAFFLMFISSVLILRSTFLANKSFVNDPYLQALVLCLHLTILIFVVLIVCREWKKTAWNSVPSSLFLFTSALCSTYWPIYNSILPQQRLLLFGYLQNGHHCLGYIGLIFFMMRKRDINLGRQGFLSLSGGNLVLFWGGLIVLSGLIIASLAFFQFQYFSDLLGRGSYRVFASLEGVFVAHYYIETIAWRYSDAHTKKHTLSLLQPLTVD